MFLDKPNIGQSCNGCGLCCDELLENDTKEEELDKMIEQSKNNPTWRKRAKISLKVIHGID